jgi:hypothetical protein
MEDKNKVIIILIRNMSPKKWSLLMKFRLWSRY